jgi:predicted transcriptional regulator
MCGTNPTSDDRLRTSRRETEAQRQRRLARETDVTDPTGAERRRRLTLEGLADVDAGRLIDDEAMRTWADSLGTDHELPLETEELRRLVRDGIDSGPGVNADAVFARLRARFGQPPTG